MPKNRARFLKSAASLTAAFTAAFTFAGCKDSTGTGMGLPASLEFTQQPPASVVAGVPFSLQLAVKDANGQPTTAPLNVELSITPIAGVPVTGATLGGGTTRPSVDGIVTFSNLTLDKTGSTNQLSAVAQTEIRFQAITTVFEVTPAAPTQVVFLTQPPASVTSLVPLSPIQVVMHDAYRNVATNATSSVTLALTSGTGSSAAVLAGTLTQGTVAGVATFNDLTVDKIGTGFTLTPSAAGLTSTPSSAFNVTVGAPAQLVFVTQPPNLVSQAVATPSPQVAIQDAAGNTYPTSISTVTMAITPGAGPSGATLTGTLSQLAANGVAAFPDLTIAKAGTGYTLTATSGSIAGTSDAFNVAAGTATRIGFITQPASLVSQVAPTPALQVAVQDAAGNTVPTASNTVALALTPGTGPAGAALAGTLSRTAAGGVATFNDVSIAKAGTGFSLTASAGSFSSVTSNIFAVAPGPPSSFTIFMGNGQTTFAGGATPTVPSAQLMDAAGNAVTGVTVTFAVQSGGGTVLSGIPMTNSIGVATVGSWILGAPGTNTLTASYPGMPTLTYTARGHFASLQASGYRTCGLTLVGKAYCWGQNDKGQLGDGTNADRAMITPVQTSLSFASLAPGYKHTCGLTSQGTAYCWGDNTHGQLGDGTNTSRMTPVAVSGGPTFASLTAGDTQTCGLTAAGAAYCWGGSTVSAGIGDGTTSDRNAPVAVSGGIAFKAIASGLNFTCGLTLAGAAYCWGYNVSGQLGDGTALTRLVPIAVLGGITFASGAAGADGYCGLTSAGAAYCWGNNAYGQVGDGSNSNRNSPVAAGNGLAFSSLVVGGSFTCGLMNSAQSYCWGRNGSGEFGDGTLVDRTLPVLAVGGQFFAKLIAGRQHACSLTGDYVAYCWGFNTFGGLGDGTTTQRTSPVAIVLP